MLKLRLNVRPHDFDTRFPANQKVRDKFWETERMRQNLSSALLVISLGIVSCATVSEGQAFAYPETWGSPLVGKLGNCLSITGEYNYFGESESNMNSEHELKLDVSVFQTVPIGGNPEKVYISYRPSAQIVQVHLLGSDLEPEAWTLIEQAVKCEDGWFFFEVNSAGSSDGTPTKSIRKLFLARSDDGYLVVNFVYDVRSSFLWMFQERNKGSVWYRFKAEEQRGR